MLNYSNTGHSRLSGETQNVLILLEVMTAANGNEGEDAETIMSSLPVG